MNCPQCKHPNADNRSYCGACGTMIARYCRSCGFMNLLADRFCGGCGLALDETASKPEKAAPSPSLPLTMPLGQDEIVYTENNDITPEAAAQLIEVAREAEQVVEEKTELQVNQADIDALFGG